MTYAILVGGPLDSRVVGLEQPIEGNIVMLDAGRALFYRPTDQVGTTSGPDPQPYRKYEFARSCSQRDLEMTKPI